MSMLALKSEMRQVRCWACVGNTQSSNRQRRGITNLIARLSDSRRRADFASVTTLELDHRRSPVLGGFCLEELARREVEHSGNDVARKSRDFCVQITHHGVVIAARVLDRVLGLR